MVLLFNAVATDTATICIFDVGAMKHRVNDVGDWWSIPANELAEVQNGNALFLNLGTDGTYQLEIVDEIDQSAVSFNLNTPSGRVFIGAGEEMSGGGFEPEGMSGFFVEVREPNYRVFVSRDGQRISVKFVAAPASRNEVSQLIRL
ncbi:hypothetical protein J2W22_004415 [Sphingomonas kyeonggiensis]|uniref:DUF6386 family protein n=1 Tax=Sphingomonas kyeonggiensis TaxID=1268553 RepID=UPI0027834EFF|nr:DUF6386 family protein [Sphingomonas kyeonggiensis]MDQ0252327.1 hypothetical protein [Sphingomonas kyeonggiensis]